MDTPTTSTLRYGSEFGFFKPAMVDFYPRNYLNLKEGHVLIIDI